MLLSRKLAFITQSITIEFALHGSERLDVPQSDEEARRLYALAAEQGIGEAMNVLGRSYLSDSDKRVGSLSAAAAMSLKKPAPIPHE